jgi:hypothetical protein
MSNEIVISVGRVIVQCGAIASALTFVTTLFYVTACAKVQWPWKIVIALMITILGGLWWFAGTAHQG